MNKTHASLGLVLSMALSACLLAAGIWMIHNGNLNQFNLEILASSHSYFFGTSIFFIVIFVMSFVAGVYGLWETTTSQRFPLLVYSWVHEFILLVMFLSGVVCIWWFRSELLVLDLVPSLTETVTIKYGQADENQTTEGYDLLQRELRCCGVNGTGDWKASEWATNQPPEIHVPDSCCVPPVDRRYCNMAADDKTMDHRDKYLWTKDCGSVLYNRLFIYMWSFFGITTLFFICQMCLSIFLCSRLDASSQDRAFIPVLACFICVVALCRP